MPPHHQRHPDASGLLDARPATIPDQPGTAVRTMTRAHPLSRAAMPGHTAEPPDVVEQDATEATPPVVWMVGPAGSGQTRLLAELTQSWRSAMRHELAPATSTAEMLAFPAEAPRLRFLLTTGLTPERPYDPTEDMAVMEESPGLVLLTLAAAETELTPLVALLARIREAHPEWPVLVAQTRLHELYPEGLQHPLPYAFDTNGTPGGAVPPQLAHALRGQRIMLAASRLRFVPLDLTEPPQGQAVLDYGADALRHAIALLAPDIAHRLDPPTDPEAGIHTQLILPWALAVAASELPPLPVLGGLPAIALQAAMVRAIAHRFGVATDGTVWAGLFSLLGGTFLLRHGLGWAVRQLFKLAPIWGAAAAAGWSFAVTFGVAEAAIHLCREEAAGRKATPAALREAFRQGHQAGAAQHGAGRGSASF